jgi:hypothetical protein
LGYVTNVTDRFGCERLMSSVPGRLIRAESERDIAEWR